MSTPLNALLRFYVSCGYIGYLPIMPGTYGAVFGCTFLFLFPSLFGNLLHGIILTSCLIIVSVFCINILRYEGTDPRFIVIDEVVGMFITMVGHKITIFNVLFGFIFFRLFDIVKPPPVRNIEKLKKGYGIVGDDMLAGLYANLLLYLIGKLR